MSLPRGAVLTSSSHAYRRCLCDDASMAACDVACGLLKAINGKIPCYRQMSACRRSASVHEEEAAESQKQIGRSHSADGLAEASLHTNLTAVPTSLSPFIPALLSVMCCNLQATLLLYHYRAARCQIQLS